MTVLNLRSWFRDPLFLLALAAGLIAFVVQSGELGSADTTHRLQTTHSFWTGEPEVFPNEFPEFGVHGRGGKLQSWYSIGQSLLFLPADVVGTYVARLPIFAQYDDTDPSVRDIIVSYSTNILLTVLTALVCFRFLRQLNFEVTQSVVGVLALLLATTHLHYTQNMMENNYIFLLSLTGFSYQYEWLRTGNRRALLIGSGAFGLNLLTRLPTGLDLLAGALFLLLVLWFEGVRGRALWERCKAYIAIALPVYLFFGLLDRLYQVYRFGFGAVFVTYITIIGRETRMRNPSLPPNYPFETPWHVGFFGALFTPEKSIFLFDPLIVLMILLCVVAWKRFSPDVKAYAIMSCPLLLAYLSFYARYTVWSGDFAWGDRYVSTTVELASLLAVPLLLRHRRTIGKAGLVYRIGAVGHQHADSSDVAGLLVAARNLPDGDPRSSDLRDFLAPEEYRCLCVGEDGCLGSEQPRHDRGSVGLRPHYRVELSALRSAASRGCACVGSAYCIRGVDCWTRRVGSHSMADLESAC